MNESVNTIQEEKIEAAVNAILEDIIKEHSLIESKMKSLYE